MRTIEYGDGRKMGILEDETTGRILMRKWKCHCNRMVSASHGDDVVCECGQLFNAYGQRLVDPCLWEEQDDY